MSVFKCKMCGGTIEFEPGATVGVCDSCGTKQTLPRLDSDRKANLYDRANHFRRNNDFDKAMSIYEQILNEDTTDAEAYWSLVLCRYGIEYVEDPSSHKRIPTVNRTQYTSILADEDYKAALRYADGYQRSIYEEEARAIDNIQKGILEISTREEPFDVFISFKETDANGRRTPDAVLANDLYHQLTQEGFKVFYAPITLEDKLGTAYEPYIFAALNSAKVMVVLGTKPENFNAVWVKNEWSRYLALIKNGAKKTLIPAYKDMDPYDLPEEFSHLMAQDMSKLGFMQDLIRGIRKIVNADTPKTTVKETVVVNAGNANTAPLLKRAFLFLEDGNWQEADEYCERVLDQDPENARAYLGKLMAELRVRRQEDLPDCEQPFDRSKNFQKAVRFGDKKLVAELEGYIDHINKRNETDRLTGIYNGAVSAMNSAGTEDAYKAAAAAFKTIPGFKDADSLSRECLERAEICRKDAVYASARFLMTRERMVDYKEAAAAFKTIPGFKDADSLSGECLERAEVCRKDAVYASARSLMTGNSAWKYESAIKTFQAISGWKDADEQIYACQRKIEEIKTKEKAERLEQERKAEHERLEAARKAEERRIAAEKAAKKRKKTISIVAPILVAVIALMLVYTKVILPKQKYNAAVAKYGQETVDAFYALQIGDTYKFGSYEQDNKTSNGKEDIEWLVLAKEDNKLLVISKYALDCQRYNTYSANVTWEACSLRKWLNSTFITTAFSTEEQAMIPTVTVSADKNPKYNTSPGNNTTDKVFLLSITEVNKYFSSDSARQCQGTAYCYAQGAKKTRNGNCWWWLRSPGDDSNDAAGVRDDGSVSVDGSDVDGGNGAVRPALWIDLGS